MKKWIVYMVRCHDNSLYTGITNELAKRIRVHNSGKGSKYTRSRLPVKLIWSKKIRSGQEARVREAAIKKLSKKEKEALVRSQIKP